MGLGEPSNSKHPGAKTARIKMQLQDDGEGATGERLRARGYRDREARARRESTNLQDRTQLSPEPSAKTAGANGGFGGRYGYDVIFHRQYESTNPFSVDFSTAIFQICQAKLCRVGRSPRRSPARVFPHMSQRHEEGIQSQKRMMNKVRGSPRSAP